MFFFSSRRRHTRLTCDWSSDVCSSDLIVGVAVDDWTIDQLIERARTSIVGTGEDLDEQVFKRFAARLSYVQGDFGDDQIGRASCRERVEVSEVVVGVKR